MKTPFSLAVLASVLASVLAAGCATQGDDAAGRVVRESTVVRDSTNVMELAIIKKDTETPGGVATYTYGERQHALVPEKEAPPPVRSSFTMPDQLPRAAKPRVINPNMPLEGQLAGTPARFQPPAPQETIVRFSVDSSKLTSDAKGRLNGIPADHDVYDLVGHTDSTGAEGHNLDLAERRALAVRTYLVGRGIPGEKIITHGLGEFDPVGDNRTAAGRAANRRVVIKY